MLSALSAAHVAKSFCLAASLLAKSRKYLIVDHSSPSAVSVVTHHLFKKCSSSVLVEQGTAGGEALQIGAARDKQTAADTAAMSGGASTGAATFAFIQVLHTRNHHDC